jgi:thiol-disulfide isomerase/thioredoxin
MSRAAPLAGLCLLAVLGCGSTEDSPPPRRDPSPPPPDPETLIGQPAPPFEMLDLQDHKITRDGLKGKIVLIEFWATWCKPCAYTAPVLQFLQTKYAGDDLIVLGANAGERGADGRPTRSRDKAVAYAATRPYTYTLTYGNDDLKRKLGVEGLPTIFLLDRHGVIRGVYVGADGDLRGDLEKAITKIIDER